MLSPVAVRRATESDLPELSALLERYFAEGDVQQIDSEATLQQQMRTPVLGWYVAESESGLQGCVHCGLTKSLVNAAECKRLYVSPHARGSGVAARLMDTIETAARDAGLGSMCLDSKDNFTVAMAMYQRRGYVECERFNENPEATIFFRKHLRCAGSRVAG